MKYIINNSLIGVDKKGIITLYSSPEEINSMLPCDIEKRSLKIVKLAQENIVKEIGFVEMRSDSQSILFCAVYEFEKRQGHFKQIDIPQKIIDFCNSKNIDINTLFELFNLLK